MIKTFENFTKVNFSDLNNNWSAEVAYHAKEDRFPYIKIEGMWTRKDWFTQREYPRVLFMDETDVNQLNEILEEMKILQDRYDHVVNLIKGS